MTSPMAAKKYIMVTFLLLEKTVLKKINVAYTWFLHLLVKLVQLFVFFKFCLLLFASSHIITTNIIKVSNLSITNINYFTQISVYFLQQGEVSAKANLEVLSTFNEQLSVPVRPALTSLVVLA